MRPPFLDFLHKKADFCSYSWKVKWNCQRKLQTAHLYCPWTSNLCHLPTYCTLIKCFEPFFPLYLCALPWKSCYMWKCHVSWPPVVNSLFNSHVSIWQTKPCTQGKLLCVTFFVFTWTEDFPAKVFFFLPHLIASFPKWLETLCKV